MIAMDIMQMCYFVTYSHNRIRFKFLTTHLGDWEPTIFLIDNSFIYRALSVTCANLSPDDRSVIIAQKTNK